jgi:hypothetical protein
MQVQGTALDQGVREAKGYHIAFLEIIDSTLKRVVEVTHFLKDGEASPFSAYPKGEDVALDVRSVDIRRGVISCGYKASAL